MESRVIEIEMDCLEVGEFKKLADSILEAGLKEPTFFKKDESGSDFLTGTCTLEALPLINRIPGVIGITIEKSAEDFLARETAVNSFKKVIGPATAWALANPKEALEEMKKILAKDE